MFCVWAPAFRRWPTARAQGPLAPAGRYGWSNTARRITPVLHANSVRACPGHSPREFPDRVTGGPDFLFLTREISLTRQE